MFDWFKKLFGFDKDDEKNKAPASNPAPVNVDRRTNNASVGGSSSKSSTTFKTPENNLLSQSRFSASNQASNKTPFEKDMENSGIKLNKVDKIDVSQKPSTDKTKLRPPQQNYVNPKVRHEVNRVTDIFNRMPKDLNKEGQHNWRKKNDSKYAKSDTSKQNDALYTKVTSRDDPSTSVNLLDYRIGGGRFDGKSINDLRNSYGNKQGMDQNRLRGDIQDELRSIDQDFSDDAALKRAQLQLALSEIGDKSRQNPTFVSQLSNIGKALVVDPITSATDQIARGASTIAGVNQDRAAELQRQADQYSESAMKAAQQGSRSLSQYYMAKSDERFRQSQRALGKVIEDADPIANAGAIASVASMPFAFSAQGTTATRAAVAGAGRTGESVLAKRSIGSLFKNASNNIEDAIPQLRVGGKAGNTTLGKVLNSTPQNLVSKAIPKASPALKSVTSESIANVLSGVPLSTTMTAQQLGSSGTLEDYLISATTGAIMDATLPAGMFGVGVGARRSLDGVKWLADNAKDVRVNTIHTDLFNNSPEYRGMMDQLQQTSTALKSANEVDTPRLTDQFNQLQNDLGNILKDNLNRRYEPGFIAGPNARGFEDAQAAGRVFTDTPDGKPRFEVDDSGMRINPVDIREGAALGDVVDHPELFDNYPGMRQVPVEVDKNLKANAGLDDRTGTILVNPRLTENVQTSQADLSRIDRAELMSYLESQGYTKAELDAELRGMSTEDIAKATLTPSEVNRLAGLENPDTIQRLRDDSAGTLLHEIQHEIQGAEGFARGTNTTQGFDNYNRSAGEAESRAVAARRNMPDAERYTQSNRSTFYDSLDVPKDELIIRDSTGRALSTEQIAQHPEVLELRDTITQLRQREADYIARGMSPNNAVIRNLQKSQEFALDDMNQVLGRLRSQGMAMSIDPINSARPDDIPSYVPKDRVQEYLRSEDFKRDQEMKRMARETNTGDPYDHPDMYMPPEDAPAQPRPDSGSSPQTKPVDDMSVDELSKHMDAIADQADKTTDAARADQLGREFDAAYNRMDMLGRAETAKNVEAEVKSRPKMTKELRKEVDNIIFESDPNLAYRLSDYEGRPLGEGGSSEIPRMHVDDLKRYFGHTEDIPTRYKRTTGKQDIDELAAHAGFDDIDQFVDAVQKELTRRQDVRQAKSELADMRKDPEVIRLAQDHIEKRMTELPEGQSQPTQPQYTARANQNDPSDNAEAGLNPASQKRLASPAREASEISNQAKSLNNTVSDNPNIVHRQGVGAEVKDAQVDMAIRESLKSMNTDVSELSKMLQGMKGLSPDDATARILKVADEMDIDLSLGVPSPRNRVDTTKSERSVLADNSDLKSPEELRKAIVDLPKVRGVENAVILKESRYQRVYGYHDKQTGQMRTFLQMRNMDGSYSKVNNSDVPIRSDFNNVKIQRLKDDAALNKELSDARQDGLTRGFIWSDTPRGGELVNDTSKQSALIYNPKKHYVEGGAVRDRSTNELLGNYIEVGPNGMRMTVGRHMIDLSDIDYGALKNVNNTFYSTDRMIEAMTQPPKGTKSVKNINRTRESLRELLVYPARRGERNMAVEGKAIAERITEWDKRFDKLAPSGKNQKAQFDKDLSLYIERKLSSDKPLEEQVSENILDAEGNLKVQDRIFRDKYGNEALTAAKEYDDWQRAVYDHTLNRINSKRIENGMEEIPRRDNYLTHMQELSDNPILDTWNNVKDGIMGDVTGNELRGGLPSQISGLSEHFKPISKYNPFARRRYGNDAPANPRDALRAYMAVGLHNIHMTDAAQLARGFESSLRASGETLDMGPGTKLNKTQKQQWKEMQASNSKDKGRLVEWAMEHANMLSGKTAKIDRVMIDALGTLGEKGMKTVGKMSNLSSQTTILGNASTVVAQTMSLPNAIAKVGPVSTIKGITRTLREIGDDTKTSFGSDAMVTRYSDPKLLRESKLRKASNTIGVPLREVEKAVVTMQYNAFYEHGLGQGLSDRAAHMYASREQGKVVPWRGAGDSAHVYNNKALNSTLLKFTREANEQVLHWWNDLSSKQKIVALGLYSATNIASEAVIGRAYLPDPFAAAYESGKEFNDSDNDDPFAVKAGHSAQRFAAVAAQAFPPITVAIQALTTKRMRENLFGEDAEISRYDPSMAITGPIKNVFGAGVNAVQGKFYDAAGDLAAGTITGGGQLRKTMNGLRDYVSGVKRNDSGRIQAQIDQSPANLIRAIFFGDNAFPEAQDYYDSKKSPLSDKQSAIYDTIRKSGGDADQYLQGVFDSRGKGGSSLPSNASMAEVQATKTVNIESGTWREEDGLIVDKSGDVQRSYYKSLAQASGGQSDGDYDNWMKAYNIDGSSTRKSKPSSNNPVLNKLSSAKDVENKASTAVSMMKGTDRYADIPDWVKTRYYKESGFSKDDVEYATKASYKVTEKMEGYWRPTAKKVSHDQLVSELLEGRKKGINGDYWATWGIIDNLRKDGYISYSEAKALKAAKYDSNGKLISGGASGGGSGRRGSGGPTKAQRKAATNAMIAAYKTSMNTRVPVTEVRAGASRPKRVQMSRTPLRSNGLQTAQADGKAPKVTVKKL